MFRKDKIAEAYIALLESLDPINKHIEDIRANGRYDIVGTGSSRDGNTTVKYIATKPDNAIEFRRYPNHPSRTDKGWYNPDIASIHQNDPEEVLSRNVPALKNTDYDYRIQTEKRPGVLYRGMSHEEYHGIQNSGKIKSNGAYNLDGQEGLTYFSTDPESATHYAHGFAPEKFKASGKHNAYVVAIKDPGTEHHVRIVGTGEHEVGLKGEIPASDILEVHEGTAYVGYHGDQEFRYGHGDKITKGSGASPTTFVAWKRIK